MQLAAFGVEGLIEAGKAEPVIERRYALHQAADALRHVGEGRAQGQSVIQIAGQGHA